MYVYTHTYTHTRAYTKARYGAARFFNVLPNGWFMWATLVGLASRSSPAPGHFSYARVRALCMSGSEFPPPPPIPPTEKMFLMMCGGLSTW